MRIGAISPSGEQLAPARCLVMRGFVPKAMASLFVGAAGKTGDTCDKDFWESLILPIDTANRLSEGPRVKAGNGTIRFRYSWYSPNAPETGGAVFNTVRDFPFGARTSRFRARISRWLRRNIPVRDKKFPFRFHRELPA
jgi:hypothetical protein